MDRLHLVGWTSDLERLVLANGVADGDDAEDAEPTHEVVLDRDTLDSLLQLFEQLGLAVVDADDLERTRPAVRTAPASRHASGWGARSAAGSANGSGAGTDDRPRASPGEVQRQLRAGRSVAAVARDSGADPEWVARWEGPILAERQQVLAAAHASSLEVRDQGTSALPLDRAVEQNLVADGVDPDTLEWRVQRRADGRWKVSAVFVDADRRRTASWRFEFERSRLGALSELAARLGHTAERRPAVGA